MVNLKHFIGIFKKHIHAHPNNKSSENLGIWRAVPGFSLSALSSSRLALFMDRLSPYDGKRGNKSLRLVSSQWWLEAHTFPSRIERESESIHSPNSPEENPQFHSIRPQVHAWIYCAGKKGCRVLSHAWSGSCPHPWIWGGGGWVNIIHTTQTGWFPRGKPRCC